MEFSITGLSGGYGAKTILSDISCEARSGEFVALIGPNGSGKSTLIKTIATLLTPSGGQIRINGKKIEDYFPGELALLMGYVPQSFRYMPFSTVTDLVLLGRRPHISWSLTEEDLSIVDDALRRLSIHHLAESYVDEISGGERQKAFIARALAQEPEMFLLDEPTSSLDVRHQIEVCRMMRDIAHQEGKMVLIAVHDLNLAFRYADRVLLLSDGRLIGQGSPEDVMTPERIRDVYHIEISFLETEHGRYLLPVMN